MDNDDDPTPFLDTINKRPNKRSHTRGRIQPNEHTGIRKPTTQTIPANQLKNPTWDHVSKQWVEGIPPPKYKKEPKIQFTETSHTWGNVGDDVLVSRMESPSRLTPWRKYYIGPPDKSRPYWRQPSHSRRLSHFKKRGGTHKRKNKHTRRRVQRRRVRV